MPGVVVVVVVIVMVIVVVVVAATGQLEHDEAETGGDQDPAHDRVLGALDG